MTESPLLFYSSIILFAVISWAMYKYVLTATNTAADDAGPPSRPPSSSTPATNGGGATTSSTGQNDVGTTSAAATANNNASQQQNNNSNGAANNSEKDESSFFANFHQPKRHPPHLYNASSSKQQNVSTIENGGIVPFKLTFASGYETRLSKSLSSEDLIITNRKQRARLFAKLFSIADRPPNRGSNVVVIITHDNDGGVAKCHKLQKSLMLLGTYYNLFLLVDHNEEEEVDRDAVKRFRNDLLNVTTETTTTETNDSNNKDKLTPQILPPHRIIFTSTPEGKVAFVRQLHEAKLVLLGSKEDKVKVELERFGFRVVSYLDEKVDGDDVSTLGQFLLP